MQLRKESKVVMRVKEIITQDKFYFKTLTIFFSQLSEQEMGIYLLMLRLKS